jgi:hypothetical protein
LLFGGAGLSATESEKVNKDVTRLDWRIASRPLLQNGADKSDCQLQRGLAEFENGRNQQVILLRLTVMQHMIQHQAMVDGGVSSGTHQVMWSQLFEEERRC